MSPLNLFVGGTTFPRTDREAQAQEGRRNACFILQSTSREFGLNDSVLFMNIQFLLAGHTSIPLGLL